MSLNVEIGSTSIPLHRPIATFGCVLLSSRFGREFTVDSGEFVSIRTRICRNTPSAYPGRIHQFERAHLSSEKLRPDEQIRAIPGDVRPFERAS